MSLRKLLFIPLLLSIVVFALYSPQIAIDAKKLYEALTNSFQAHPDLLLGSVFLIFIGHLFRAFKYAYLIKPVTNSQLASQFRALSVGYLFNTVLPFRLGELVRAHVVSTRQAVSYSFILLMIVIERVVDVVILCTLAVVFVSLNILPFETLAFSLVSLFVALCLCVLVWMILHENTRILRWFYRTTELFNQKVKIRYQFKYWSAVYGAQQVMTAQRMMLFILMSLIMWGFYLAATLFLALSFQATNSLAHSIASYLAASIPLGPANLGTYSSIYRVIADQGSTMIALSEWVLIVLPMGIVGLVFFLTMREPAIRKLAVQYNLTDLRNKLARHADISRGLELFLDNYFKGNSLSKIVSRLERKSDFSLIRYFKGGSDAITILADEHGKTEVKKIIAIDLKDRLKAQYDWLAKFNHPGIVGTISEETKKDFYAINLDYDPDNQMFFDTLHSESKERARKVMDEVWRILKETVHKKTKKVYDPQGLDTYINKHVFGCLDKAMEVDERLEIASTSETISINGKEYRNIYQIMQLIRDDKMIMKELATYRSSGAVHGDVAIDNILVSQKTGAVTLIDPAPDGNIINGPVFDFGKNMQSLYCGYEFLFRSTEAVDLADDGSIHFIDGKSLKYTQLCDYVRTEIAPKYLSEGEQRAILFHAGVLLIRRLKHQVYQDPKLTLAMYGTGVKTLNDFYAQYYKDK